MKKSFVFIAILFAAGCATPEQDAQRAAAICQEAGGTAGTRGFEQCVGRQVAEIQKNRHTTRQAIAVGLKSYGASAQSYTPRYDTSISCTSRQSYNTTYTNCY